MSPLEQNRLLLLALKAKHHLTNEALTDIVKVINVVSGDDCVPSTKYMFEKDFSDIKGVTNIHFVCRNCFFNLDISLNVCSYCDKIWNGMQKKIFSKDIFSFTFHEDINCKIYLVIHVYITIS